MNRFHHWFCRSSLWSQTLRLHVIPWALEQVEPGTNVLELGPGYGASTDALRSRCGHLTCIESDHRLAARLQKRMEGANASVLRGDAGAMQFSDDTFDGAVCFMMLHHVAPAEKQNRLFAEIARVLRPGGIFAGADSPASRVLRVLHLFDTVVMVDPSTLSGRLQAVGFEDIHVDANRYAFRFRARKPAARFR